MWSIRDVLNVLARRIIPWTSYAFDSSNSAKYEPSCPVIPVIIARFILSLYDLFSIHIFVLKFAPPEIRVGRPSILRYLALLTECALAAQFRLTDEATSQAWWYLAQCL